MASFFNLFGRQTNKNSGQNSLSTAPSSGGAMQSSTQAPSIPQIPASTSLSASMQQPDPAASMERPQQQQHNQQTTRRVPFFFREENSNLVVKGNFMTLAAKPEHLDLGEWLAHQVVEQYRLLEGWIRVVQEVDGTTGLPVCNQNTCPTMNASEYIYTWLDSKQTPTRIPAAMYMSRVQKWVLGKITDQRLFPVDTNEPTLTAYPSTSVTPGPNKPIAAGPTNLNMSLSALSGREWLGKSAGFPENFETEVKHLYRQMFRCYAHLYHAHWLDPFYHLGVHKELNTCLIHFVNVGRLFDLLPEKDLVPMQPLIDIWIGKGLLPPLKSASSENIPAVASASGLATTSNVPAASAPTVTATTATTAPTSSSSTNTSTAPA